MRFFFCSGQIDCTDGTDEIDCLALELNQCRYEMEYRYRQGTCIPLQAVSNYDIDCIDASDEYRLKGKAGGLSSDLYCDILELPSCYDHFCGANAFACGDGTCSNQVWSQPKCNTKRDLRYVKNILSTSIADNDSCWTFAICQLGFQKFFPYLTPSICSMSTCKKAMFLFPSEHPIAHPSVRFVYETNRNFANNFIDPNYICFDTLTCQNHHLHIVTLLNQTCSPWNNFTDFSYSKYDWNELIFAVRQIFATCYLPDKETSHHDLLFNCGQSFFYI